jgi:hypothetical protein
MGRPFSTPNSLISSNQEAIRIHLSRRIKCRIQQMSPNSSNKRPSSNTLRNNNTRRRRIITRNHKGRTRINKVGQLKAI